ncbi:MAG: MFS transporter [Promethearchaeota archaeon]|jgi:GPH family glycoside/pentoside/hexuronide:cation symporter
MSNSNLKQDVNIKRYGKGQKWSFGMASFAQFFINSAFNTWVFSFYYTAVGLHALTITAAFSIWTIWNAFNDPLIGFLSDRTKTRWGRRRPYLMIGIIPVLIIEIILWIPPTGNELLGFLYLLLMLICYDTFYTMLALPTDSLFPELYTSVEERAQVNTIRQILSTVGLILAFLVPGIFIGDLTEMSGYLMNGVVTSVIVGVTMFIFIKWGAKERVEFKMDYRPEFGFFKGLLYTFKNKGFLLYTAMFFLYEYTLLVLATTVPLYGIEVLGLASDDTLLIALLLGAMFIISILAVFIWKKLDLRLGSKKAYGISIVAYIIASIPLLFVSTYMVGLLVVIFMGLGFGGMLYFVYLIVADIIDEDELKTGVRREGTFFGITNFFMRLSMILSIVTVGLVFTGTDWGEYNPIPGINTIIGLKMLVFTFPAIALSLTLVCLYFYPFSKSRVDEIKAKLLELHNEKRDKVGTK